MAGRQSGPVTKMFGAGRRGIDRYSMIAAIDPDALYDALNVRYHNGSLRQRMGLVTEASISGTTPPSAWTRPVGSFSCQKSNGAPIIFVQTLSQRFKLDDFTSGSWTNITGTDVPGGSADQPARLTSVLVGSDVNIVSVNGFDDISASVNGGNFTDVDTGSAGSDLPTFTDITTVRNRLVAIAPPYKVQWCEPFTTTQWLPLNFKLLSQTPGHVVAVRSTGPDSCIVYKQDSIWMGQSGPGAPSGDMAFAFVAYREGPAGPSAVVDADGMQYYMTSSGRIGMVSGGQHAWIAEGIWPYLSGDIDPLYPMRIWGTYDALNHEVLFFYVRSGDAGVGPLGGILLKLPRPSTGVDWYAAYPCIYGIPLSTGCPVNVTSFNAGTQYPSGTFLVHAHATTPVPELLSPSGLTDDSVAFTARFQTGVLPVKDVVEIGKIEIEVFAERAGGYGTIDIQPVTSYILDAAGGTVGSAQSIDLTTSTLTRDVHGYNVSGRFIGLRGTWTSDTSTVRYKGAVMTGYQLEA